MKKQRGFIDPLSIVLVLAIGVISGMFIQDEHNVVKTVKTHEAK